LIEVWKACDMDLKNVEFVWSNEAMQTGEYWKTVMNIARTNTVKRILRCSQIMGRSENENLYASQIFYPCMQCADTFYLKADIDQLGMDQRKCGMLAREVGPKLGFWKPVVVSHHMLMGLGEPPKGVTGVDRVTALKMSKSNPDTAIFMDDSVEEVMRKIKKAYCPEGVVEENPILEYYKYIICEVQEEIVIERHTKFGGDLVFAGYSELELAFSKKEVHPLDLKQNAGRELNALLEPVRNKLRKNSKARKYEEDIRSFPVS
jgi:tyrosyl-tRNA synthetase